MSIISNTDVKTYLSITESTFDATITSYISKVESQIVDMVGQNIDSTTSDVIFKGNGKTRHLLLNKPVTDLNSLSYRAVPTDDWTTITSTDYTLYEADSVYWIYYNSFYSSYEYKANITYGYDTIPEPVKMVAIEMVTDKLLDSNILNLNEGFRHGLSARAEGVNGYTGTTSFKTADYWHRLAKYSVVLK